MLRIRILVDKNKIIVQKMWRNNSYVISISYKIFEIVEILSEYYYKFEGYMNTLIEVMIPDDYLNSEVKVFKILGNIKNENYWR